MSLKTELVCDNCGKKAEERRPRGWWSLNCYPMKSPERGYLEVLHLCDDCAPATLSLPIMPDDKEVVAADE